MNAALLGLLTRKFWSAFVVGVCAALVALISYDGDPTAIIATLIIGAISAALAGYLTPNQGLDEQAQRHARRGSHTSTVRSAHVRLSGVASKQQDVVPRWLQIVSPIVGIVTGILGSVLAYAALQV